MNFRGIRGMVKTSTPDTENYENDRVGSLREGMSNSLEFGLASSGKFANMLQFAGAKTLETLGVELDPDTISDIKNRMDSTTEIMRYTREASKDYMTEGGLMRQIGVGGVLGLAELTYDAPQIATNYAMSTLGGAIGGKLVTSATSGATKLAGNIAWNTVENVGYDYLQTEAFLEKDYTKEDFENSVISSVGMGIVTGGLQYTARKMINDKIKVNNKVTPQEIDTKIKEMNDVKEVSTGVDTPKELLDVKSYNGFSEAEILENMSKTADREAIITEKNLLEQDLEAKRKKVTGYETEAEALETENNLMSDIENRRTKVETEYNEIIDEFTDAERIEYLEKLQGEKKVIANVIQGMADRKNLIVDQLDNRKKVKRKGRQFDREIGVKSKELSKKLQEISDVQDEIAEPKRYADVKEAMKRLDILAEEFENVENSATKKIANEKRIKELRKKVRSFDSAEEIRNLRKDIESKKNIISETEEEYFKLKSAEELYKKGIYDIDTKKVQKLAETEFSPEKKRDKILYENMEAEAKLVFEIEPEDSTKPPKTGSKEPSVKTQAEKPATPKEGKKIEPKDKPEIVTYGSNRVIKARLQSGLNTLAKSIKSIKGGTLTRGTARKFLDDNILSPFHSIQKETANALLNKLQIVENNSILDFTATVRKLNAHGIRMSDLLIGKKSLDNVPFELRDSISNFINSSKMIMETLEKYNKDFNYKTAVISSKFSRNAFIKRYSQGVELKVRNKFGDAYYDLRGNDKSLKMMKENFIRINVGKFNGHSTNEKYFNARSFANILFGDIEKGVRGTAGRNTTRTKVSHRYSIFNKFNDEKFISLDNLDTIMNGSTFEKDSHFVANFISDISHTKALNDVFGEGLDNFVNGGSELKAMFSKAFKGLADTSYEYNNAIDNLSLHIRDSIGLTSELNSPLLTGTRASLNVLYQTITPLMALKQVAEIPIATLDKVIHWEKSALSYPKVLLKDLKNLSKKEALSNEFTKNLTMNGMETIAEIQKEISELDVSMTGKTIAIIKTASSKVKDFNETISLMKPYENFFQRAKSSYALIKTKEIFSDSFEELSNFVNVKGALDRIGLDKLEFDFIQKNIQNLETIEPYSVRKALEGADFTELKTRYNLTDSELSKLLSDKIRTLQESIMASGDSTKSSIYDKMRGSSVSSQIYIEGVSFLKKSGFSSLRRLNDMLFSSTKYHQTGQVVNEQAFKNLATFLLASPIIYTANAIQNVTRKSLTTDEDFSTILEDEFLFKDEYGSNLTLAEALAKGSYGVASGMYVNVLLTGSYIQGLGDKIQDGHFKGVMGQIQPQQFKVMENMIKRSE